MGANLAQAMLLWLNGLQSVGQYNSTIYASSSVACTGNPSITLSGNQITFSTTCISQVNGTLSKYEIQYTPPGGNTVSLMSVTLPSISVSAGYYISVSLTLIAYG